MADRVCRWRSVTTLRISPQVNNLGPMRPSLLARVYSLPRETVPTVRNPDQTGKEKGQLRLTFSFAWRQSPCAKVRFSQSSSPQHNGLHKTTRPSSVNTLLHFIDSGFKQTLFTKKLYPRLSNTFGHIAHYNQGLLGGVVRRSLRSGSLRRSRVYLQ